MSLLGAGKRSLNPLSSQTEVVKLPCEWTIWFDNGAKRPESEWFSGIKQVASFGTVQDFWAYADLFVVVCFVVLKDGRR